MKPRIFLAAFALLVLSLCPSAHAQGKDTLTIGVAQFPASLNPYYDSLTVKSYTLDFGIRPMTAYDKDWKLACLLCTELPTLENGLAKFEDLPGGGKGMAVTFALKPELKWADGTPVSAKDVLFTWNFARDPASGVSNTHPWNRATAIDVVDDHTVTIHIASVRVDYNIWDTLLPAHIEGPAFEKAGSYAEYQKQTAFSRAPTTPGLWNGPYMMTGYQSGVQVVLEPNPHWGGPKPAFRRIVLKLIENTAALQANLLSGDVDMVPGEGIGLTIDQVIALRKANPDRFEYVFKPSLTYEHIDLKAENPLLADIRIRRALLIAIDRQTLVDRLFEGMQPVADSWVNPLDPNFSKAISRYPYDPNLARAMLAEAGWRPGSDGYCRNAAGDKLSFEINTTAGNRLRELTEQVLQNMWKAACIEVTIRNEPARTLFGETLRQRKYTAMLMYSWSSGVGESPRGTLGSDRIPTAANNWGGNNYIAFSDPEMDRLIGLAETELDSAKQKLIWAQMQKIYVEQVRALPLFFRSDAHVIPKWLKGYTPTGHSDLSPLYVEAWHPG
jgi:peptide/nickel transport system substrate-binding protein